MSVDLRNCPRCGSLFAYIGKNLCPACLAAEEKEFELLRVFLRDNPRATLEEAAEATGVKAERIFKFLRAGRIVASQESTWLTCERCGKPIVAGRFCTDCAGAIRKELRLDPLVDRDQDRMHTADLIKKKKD